MKKYFFSDGTNVFGPFSIEELRDKNITRETKVWFQELGDWMPAGSVSELNEVFVLTPPPIAKSSPKFNDRDSINSQTPPKTWLFESILVTLFCCLPLGIAGIVNASKVESRFYAGDIDGAKKASEDAKTWTSVSFGLGLAGIVIYFIIFLASGESGF